MRRTRISVAASVVALGIATCPGAHAHQAAFVNDYPTVARADYIFGCMAVNGQTRRALEQCACSIDLIATILPYDAYVDAETVLMVEQKGGENTSIFRTSPLMRKKVDRLRSAQAEAEIRCF
jgi:hypothetical protein